MPRAASRTAWRWARRHPLLAGGLLLLSVLVVGLIVDVLRVRSEVEAGKDELSSLSIDQLDGDLVGSVEAATAHLDQADEIADRSPFLSLVSVVPLIDRQIEGMRTLTEAASDLGVSARETATLIDRDLESAGSEPAARLRLLDTIDAELDQLEDELADVDLGEGQGLVGPLGDARAELREELDEVPERFADARTRVRALQRVLEGPTRYLVLAANNAEMRGGAGMPLSGGVLTIHDGDLEFGEFESIANRWAGPIDRSLVPTEYAKTYETFRVGQSWLQTAVSPNFPAVAPIYDAMSAAFPSFGPVDGVIEVDTVALRYLLEVIGPVEVNGETFTADNIERRLLNENYLRFGATWEGMLERRDDQGAVATEIFDALKTRDVSVGELMTAMQDAAAGRHLLAYAEDDDVLTMFHEIGASGALHRHGLMITVQNLAADKLDWYIDPSATIETEPIGTVGWNVRLTVEVPNPEREGNTEGVESYIEGYDNGIHRAFVAIYLPDAATNIRTLDLDYSHVGHDPPMMMVGKLFFIEEGESESVAIEFELPAENMGVHLLPSGRLRPTSVVLNGQATDDAVRRFLVFPPLTEPADEPQPAPVIAALLAIAGAITIIVGQRRALAWRQGRTSSRPLVAPSEIELRLPQLGLLLFFAAGATLVVFAAVDWLRPR